MDSIYYKVMRNFTGKVLPEGSCGLYYVKYMKGKNLPTVSVS